MNQKIFISSSINWLTILFDSKKRFVKTKMNNIKFNNIYNSYTLLLFYFSLYNEIFDVKKRSKSI